VRVTNSNALSGLETGPKKSTKGGAAASRPFSFPFSPWLGRRSRRAERPWEFTLRLDLKFSNGEGFGAAVVEQVFAILISPEAQRWSRIREVRVTSNSQSCNDWASLPLHTP
jgi:hypothetical protein